jgi:hypothetical protein
VYRVAFKIADAYVAVTLQDDGIEDELKTRMGAAGSEAGAAAGQSLGQELKDAAEQAGDEAGQTLADRTVTAVEDQVTDSKEKLSDTGREVGEDVGAGIGDGLSDGVEPGLKDVDEKTKTSTEDTGKSAGDGMSKAIVAALIGAAAIGPAAILTGMSAAVDGVTAYALKGNAAIAASYTALGKDAEDALSNAAAPAAGTLLAAVTSLEGAVNNLRPQLKSLFVDAEPDITSLTSGVEGLAGNVMPGLSAAVSGSQDIVSDFANELPTAGSGISGFFQGLTEDSATTGAGFASALGTVSNLLNTTGHVAGDVSTAISADLLGIDPIINTTTSAIRALASPETVGSVAGLFGAMKLDPSISSGLGKAADGMLSLSEKAAGGGAAMEAVSGASLKMASGLDSAASVMGGPWGLAIGAGVGLLSGLVGSMIQAQHATDALTLSQEGLQQAIAKDLDTAGATTAQYVLQQDTANGLAAAAQAAGVSMATYTQAVFGNTDAQQKVTDASNKTAAAQQKQADAATAGSQATGKYASDLQDANDAANAAPYDKAVAAQNQLTSSMKAQAAQITQQINDQEKLDAATNTLNNTTAIFQATMKSGYQTLVASAQQSADSSIAALNLGSSQTTLSQQLEKGVAAYTEATAGATGYQAVLNSLNGTAMSSAQAQTSLNQDLLNAQTSWAQNSYSLDQSTQAGINNAEAAQQAAAAIQTVAVSTYQSTGSMNQANSVIQQQVQAYVDATGATGTAKQAIISYIQSLIQIPSNVNTNVNANTAPAQQTLENFVTWGNGQTVTVQVNAGGATNLLGAPHRATGGTAQAGRAYIVGDGGKEEVFVPATDGYIYPSVSAGMRAIGAKPGAGAAIATSGGMTAQGAGGLTANFYYSGQHLPDGVQRAEMMRDLASVGAFG